MANLLALINAPPSTSLKSAPRTQSLQKLKKCLRAKPAKQKPTKRDARPRPLHRAADPAATSGQPARAKTRVSASSSNRAIADLSLEYVTGDLRDQSSLARAMTGVQRVFHVAADYRLWSKNPQDIYDSNVAAQRIYWPPPATPACKSSFTPAP